MFGSTTMANKSNLKPLPVANYVEAIASALEWLGDRYLLAKPINQVASGTSSAVERDSPLLRQ